MPVAERSNLKVLMAVQQLRRTVPGGIGAYSRGLLSGLAQCAQAGEGTELTLLASRAPGIPGTRGPDPLSAFGHPLVLSHLPGPALTRAWDHRLVHAPRGYDVVHSVSLAAPPVRSADPARSVVTVHDMAWRRHPEATTTRGRTWHEMALRRARDSAAALVVTSTWVAADLMADGVRADRITIVHGGSDHLVPADLAQADALLQGLGVNGEFLLTVSTLEPRKNVERLLTAYRRIRSELPETWPLVIVGPTGWGPALVAPDDQAGVVFTGAVSNAVLTGLYERARAFAYVPLTEGYGLPPLEALRVGTPAAVSDEVPSVHDLDQAGERVVRIVDPHDVDDIAAGLVEVLCDDDLRAELRQRGAEHARARTWRAAAESHLALWETLA
jgi:glycosyltransferase involved in cell wall biosynthesis